MSDKIICLCENCGWEGEAEPFNGSWADWIGCQDSNQPVILPEGDCPECDCTVYRNTAVAAMSMAQAAPDLLQAAEGILQWWETTPCRPAGDEPLAIIEARAAIAKAKGTEPETSQPEPEADTEPEQRSNAELVDAILDMLGDTELTGDDIIDNCRFFAEILQQRFPLPQDTRMVATLMHELQKPEG